MTTEIIDIKKMINEFLTNIIGSMFIKYGANFVLDIVEAIKKKLNAEVGAIFFLDRHTRTLTLYADDGYIGDTDSGGSTFVGKMYRSGKIKYELSSDNSPNEIKGEGITAYVARTNKPFRAKSFKELKRHPAWAGKWDKYIWKGEASQRFKSLLAVPLSIDNKCVGVLKVENKKNENNQYVEFNDEDEKELLIVAKILAKTIEESKVNEIILEKEKLYPDISRIIIDAIEEAQEKGIKGIRAPLAADKLIKSIEPRKLIDNLAEFFRITRKEVEKVLESYGLGEIVAFSSQSDIAAVSITTDTSSFKIKKDKAEYPYRDYLQVIFRHPDIDEVININKAQQIGKVLKSVLSTINNDPFLELYRKDVLGYYKTYSETMSPQIHKYIESNFSNNGLKYLVNSGMGANEQFSHFVASLNNENLSRKITWIMCDCPKELKKLPKDVNKENTLFVEFSRSGKTEETIKIHEFTPRDLKRIVFANNGPLKEVGERDNNLILPLPDEISGRYGRNKTPILIAPMDIAGLDTEDYWGYIDDAIKNFDFDKDNSLPVDIAKYIYCMQAINNINHIYMGTNNDFLLESADELVQFWNEGANKDQNDITLSRYFGLPRDSHLNIEGILANAKTKMGIFLIYSNRDCSKEFHPLINKVIDPINEQHKGLIFGDEDIVLAMANFQRFSQLMPTILIDVKKIDYKTSAILGQLWADITYVYCRLKNIDPGSNPEVKYVRDRSAELLTKKAQEIRDGLLKT